MLEFLLLEASVFQLLELRQLLWSAVQQLLLEAGIL